MNARVSIANAIWFLTCLPAWHRFSRAISHPAVAQGNILRRLIERAAHTEFGREHRFDQIRNYKDFVERVPTRNYGDLSAWIDRIRQGKHNLLTPERVNRLATTSGTTGGRKLIPYTNQLQAEFGRAVDPWIVDLFLSDPKLMTGPAYWSITPVISEERVEDSAVPIGFEEDSEYLGGLRRRLINWIMAVPSDVRRARSVDEFRDQTLMHLRRHRDLRLISVWHPSMLTILMSGVSAEPPELWPDLRLISCWADAQATTAAAELQQRFPGAKIQAKGLIATEAIVSIPFRGQHPVAVCSHFLEFIDEGGKVRLVQDLLLGARYQVIVTTGGGLWRYRLNDVVCVDGFVQRTPSIRFLGKAGAISDLFGEKLSDAFVARVLEQLRVEGELNARFAMLAPEDNAYVLFVQGTASRATRERLDRLLRDNPHYAYCRDLGQLAPPRLFEITSDDAHADMVMRLRNEGQRLGDIKPAALSVRTGWSKHFQGHFVTRACPRVFE